MKKGPTEYAGRHTSRPVTPVQQVVHEPVAGKKPGAKPDQPTKVGQKKKSQDL